VKRVREAVPPPLPRGRGANANGSAAAWPLAARDELAHEINAHDAGCDPPSSPVAASLAEREKADCVACLAVD
jgi:hypothetical protein